MFYSELPQIKTLYERTKRKGADRRNGVCTTAGSYRKRQPFWYVDCRSQRNLKQHLKSRNKMAANTHMT